MCPPRLATSASGSPLTSTRARIDDRELAAQVGNVADDVRRQDHDHVGGDVGEQVVEADALSGSRPGGRLVDDDELRVAEQRLGDAEALPHAAREAAEVLLANGMQVDAMQQRVDGRRRDGASTRPFRRAK
jgi:hypothetical protein